MMHLVRALNFGSAFFSFNYKASHIKGSVNVIADSLSYRKASPCRYSLLLSGQKKPSSSEPRFITRHTGALAESGLEVSVPHFYNKGLSESTSYVYKSAHSRYLKFCQVYKLVGLPTTEKVLCYYVSYLAKHAISKTFIN